MHDFVQALIAAVNLLGNFDPELVGIVALSLRGKPPAAAAL